ncbi:benenodin family lasso peptide [Sphingomonas canadensis]|uniref:Benenodin family lasso peptide n=1 Tax=Sphingomonas canadensis TaxID=1219257 RepID=A0ABW3HAK0_9SPHN|nr:benenodin family lasso peptide [Sphingomonas canadensis]MCW3838185.1 benenodin family lasso peptide [Sphingomonas canadensis]
MERINEKAVDLIDLGAASVETQVKDEGNFDGLGYQIPAGLSDS